MAHSQLSPIVRASGLSVLLLTAAFVAPVEVRAQMVAPAAPRVQLDVPYVPTPDTVVTRMLEMGEVGKDDFVIDLGSGDGRIAIAAVKERGAMGAMGVDLNPERIKEARENAKAARVSDKVTFEQRNLFDTDLSKATVITMYLLESVNAKLRPTLLDLKPGTRVVSHAFSLGDWQADQRANVEGRTVYLWIVPAKVDGRWTLTDGERRVILDLNQSFQNLEGSATLDGRNVPVRDARLSGDEIELTLATDGGPLTYQGKVNGRSIEPTGGTSSWHAERN